ncbi:MAG: SGNH/GDSL hydrolase family protein [Gemmatimonadaceae bacterium]
MTAPPTPASPVPPEAPKRSLRRTIKLVVFALTPAIVLLVLAETAATVTIDRRWYVRADSASGGSQYSMRIGRWPWSRRTFTTLNSQGFPDEEFPAAVPKNGCHHIVFAGDSYVFGDGVNRDSSFVSIIRRRTAGRAGRCYRVFNIGVRGTTIDRQAKNILQTLDQLKPDAVILGQYQNDLLDLNSPGAILDPNKTATGARAHGGDSVRVKVPIMSANLMKMLTYQAFGFMIRNNIKRDVLRHWSVIADTARRKEAELFKSTYAKLYKELVDTLASRRVAFGVVIIPSKLDVMAGRYPEEEFLVGLANQDKVPHLLLLPTFDAHRTPYPFLMYDGHLNEQGNRIVADAVFDWLFRTEPAPFPSLR